MTHHFEYAIVRRTRATPQTLFAIVSDGSKWSRWARPLIPYSRWETLGPDGDGGVGAIRAVGTRRRPNREMTEIHEPGVRHGYTILSTGRAVRDYHAVVTFDAEQAGTRVEWRGRFDTDSRIVGHGYRLVVLAIIRTLSKKLVAAAERQDT
ncbi:SRPBCC family protein [Mycobacterium sp. BMJ-28]